MLALTFRRYPNQASESELNVKKIRPGHAVQLSRSTASLHCLQGLAPHLGNLSK